MCILFIELIEPSEDESDAKRELKVEKKKIARTIEQKAEAYEG